MTVRPRRRRTRSPSTCTTPAIVVNKSTMPIGTGDWVQARARRYGRGAARRRSSNPEFLREGAAVADFMQPDRVVLGADDPAAAEKVAELYRPLHAPVVITDLRTAEMIKYASNAFLATKISFINEIAAICEKMGADVKRGGARAWGCDARIGARVPGRRASASAAPASRRTCRRWRTWPRSRLPPAAAAGGDGDQPRRAAAAWC